MLNYFKTWMNLHLGNEEGQGMIEYVLLVALIAIVLIVVLTAVGGGIGNKFNEVVTELNK